MALTREVHSADIAEGVAGDGRGRRRVFLFTALPLLLGGLIYTVLQPAEYESSASVLMSAPTAIDEQMLSADIQGVAIQRRTLTGPEITRAVAARMNEDYGTSLENIDLRRMLRVDGVPETNLLELTAQGPDGTLLPSLVESWIEVYADIRAEDISTRRDRTLTELESELEELALRLDGARTALQDYREEHDIISMDRQENAVLARLDGLNSALNNAVEEEVLARSRLETLRSTLAAGEQVVPGSERSEVSAMAQELATLRSRLAELRARYTDDYILKDPRVREIPQQIAELETALAAAYSAGADAELASAQRDYDAARQAVRDLEARLAAHKTEVASFNTVYATHEALVEDLARLEDLNRETQARLVQIQVRQLDRYPQIDVVRWPDPQAQRTGPPYLLLLGATLGGSLLAAIFTVWLYTYLNPTRRDPAFVTLSGVHLYPGDQAQALEQGAAAARLQSGAGAAPPTPEEPRAIEADVDAENELPDQSDGADTPSRKSS